MPENDDQNCCEQRKRPRNWDRIVARLQWVAAGLQILLAIFAALISEWEIALRCLAFALFAAVFAFYFRGEANLRDHDSVVRVYERGRLRDQLALDFPPDSGLHVAEVRVGVANVPEGCTCGEVHDDVIREPHKDEL
jgi:hypothetical protein